MLAFATCGALALTAGGSSAGSVLAGAEIFCAKKLWVELCPPRKQPTQMPSARAATIQIPDGAEFAASFRCVWRLGNWS